MNDQPRPVWIDQRLAGVIAYAKARAEADWKDEAHAAELGEILAAWDAAPANATEAIAEALFNNSNEPGEPAWKDATSQSDEWVKQGYRDGEAPAVLRALGRPS